MLLWALCLEFSCFQLYHKKTQDLQQLSEAEKAFLDLISLGHIAFTRGVDLAEQLGFEGYTFRRTEAVCAHFSIIISTDQNDIEGNDIQLLLLPRIRSVNTLGTAWLIISFGLLQVSEIFSPSGPCDLSSYLGCNNWGYVRSPVRLLLGFAWILL